MGLERVTNPGEAPDAGIFNLPPGFDTKKWASEWVELDRVKFKEQRQMLPGTGYSADGWKVYKAETKDGMTKVVNGKNKTFVLMVRDRALQTEINALFGNVSKQRINREVVGETLMGAAPADSGVLTEQALRANQVGGNSDISSLELNSVKQPEVAST